MPGTDGGLFVGSRSTAAGLNRPRWAKITDFAGENPVRHAWEEQTWQAFAPGSDLSIGLARLDGGMFGTADSNPVVDPSGKQFNAGDFLLVQGAYFDPTYDWVFAVVNGGGGATGVLSFAKCLTTLPTDGRYNARLQLESAVGALTDNGSLIWMREGNVAKKLIKDQIYACKKTGRTESRDVYTCIDRGFWAKLTSSTETAYAWTEQIEGAGGTFSDGTRTGTTTVNPAYELTAKKKLDLLTPSPVVWLIPGFNNSGSAGQEYLFHFHGENWFLSGGTETGRITRHELNSSPSTAALGIDWETDVTTAGLVKLRHKGLTINVFVLTSCSAGVLMKRLFYFENGLLKRIDDEETA